MLMNADNKLESENTNTSGRTSKVDVRKYRAMK